MLANQAQQVIEDKLKSEKIYTQPTVSLLVEGSARFVNIGGAVHNPGRIPYTPDLTVMSALNAAGGLNDFGDPKKVIFIRDGKKQVLDVRKFEKDPSKDIKVQPGDQIKVDQGWF